MKKLLSILIFLVPSIVFGQASNERMEKYFNQIVQQPRFIESVLDSYGLTGIPRVVMREHMKELYNNKALIKRMVGELASANFQDKTTEDSRLLGRMLGSELVMSLAMKGMTRLPVDDARRFFSFMHKWMIFANDDDCKWMMTVGTTSSALDAGSVEMKYYSRFTKPELQSYFRLLRKSIAAEINDFPSKKTLNPSQVQIADSAFEREFDLAIKNGRLTLSVLTAMSDMENSSARDVCEAGKFIFQTVSNMKGFTGDLVVTKMILSME